MLSAEPGCASVPGPPRASYAALAAQLDPVGAEALLDKIDRRLAWIDEATLPEDVLPLSRMPRGADYHRDLDESGALVRKSIRTLYLTGRFLDVPDVMKVHPGMQRRVREMQPEMDDAVLGMTDRLARMSPEDHRRVQAYLQKDERFGERLARVLETTAVDDGLSLKRTFGLRSSTMQLAQRMAAQSPAPIDIVCSRLCPRVVVPLVVVTPSARRQPRRRVLVQRTRILPLVPRPQDVRDGGGSRRARAAPEPPRALCASGCSKQRLATRE